MKLRMDGQGHLHAGKRTTDPLHSGFYVGTSLNFIGFDALVIGDGRVAIHSALHFTVDDLEEDFLYEVVAAEQAYPCLTSMLDDAAEYLNENGFIFDMNNTLHHLADKMVHEIEGNFSSGLN